jgi:tRNA modification GTPase
VHVWNKADASHMEAPHNIAQQSVRLSAKTGEGLQSLREKLLQLVGWQGGSAEGLYMARERHVQALHEVSQHLHIASDSLNTELPALDVLAEELRLAQNALNTITGEFTSDDLLGVIFTSFCIGK